MWESVLTKFFNSCWTCCCVMLHSTFFTAFLFSVGSWRIDALLDFYITDQNMLWNCKRGTLFLATPLKPEKLHKIERRYLEVHWNLVRYNSALRRRQLGAFLCRILILFENLLYISGAWKLEVKMLYPLSQCARDFSVNLMIHSNMEVLCVLMSLIWFVSRIADLSMF